MSEGPQYTNCIDKADWKSAIAWVGVADIGAAVGAIVAVLAGFPAVGVIVAFASGAEILRKVAEWQLNGKLICLKNVKRRVFEDPDPDRICVLGTVLDFEKVGEDKSGFENIDNDFALNLFIAPFPISDVAVEDPAVLKRHMEKSPQGDLIQNPDAPEPAAGDPDPSPGPLKRKDNPLQNFGPMPSGFTGYQRGLMLSASFPRPIPSNAYRDPHELVKVDPKFKQMGDDAYTAFVAEFQGEVIENGQPLSKEMKDAILAAAAKDPLADGHVSAKFYQAVEAAFHFTEKNAPHFIVNSRAHASETSTMCSISLMFIAIQAGSGASYATCLILSSQFSSAFRSSSPLQPRGPMPMMAAYRIPTTARAGKSAGATRSRFVVAGPTIALIPATTKSMRYGQCKRPCRRRKTPSTSSRFTIRGAPSFPKCPLAGCGKSRFIGARSGV
jgi:hypothetical protein